MYPSLLSPFSLLSLLPSFLSLLSLRRNGVKDRERRVSVTFRFVLVPLARLCDVEDTPMYSFYSTAVLYFIQATLLTSLHCTALLLQNTPTALLFFILYSIQLYSTLLNPLYSTQYTSNSSLSLSLCQKKNYELRAPFPRKATQAPPSPSPSPSLPLIFILILIASNHTYLPTYQIPKPTSPSPALSILVSGPASE